MPRCSSLWELLAAAGEWSRRFLADDDLRLTLDQLECASSLRASLEELRDAHVLVATGKQLSSALALIELDGVARRIVLCPPDVPDHQVAEVAAIAKVGVVVTDGTRPGPGIRDVRHVMCDPRTFVPTSAREGHCRTEWILLTSGTTGRPKLVAHTLASLADAIRSGGTAGGDAVWSTFYDIRRYGGLQVLLRALISGGSLILSGAGEPTGAFLGRAGANGLTHISGTPSHWRRALMSGEAHRISPRYVRLSGEIADQAILDRLKAFYPRGEVAHAFASTEAGVAFDVRDGLTGFPAELIRREGAAIEMRVLDGSLRIRSTRTASRYLDDDANPVVDEAGFVDTGDMVELRGDRYHFIGRREGIINVGGQKVHPEEVEAIINRHLAVQMSLVKARRNPITGSIVVADIVMKAPVEHVDTERVKDEILHLCRSTLTPHKVPARIRFVPSLDVSASGKLARPGA